MPGLKLGKEAQNKFEEAKVSPDRAGTLEKKGAKRKNWKDRWFVLKDNYLFYCKNEKSNPQGIINLHGCTVSRIEGPTARPNAFSLLAPKSVSIDAKWTNRTYLMAAKSTKEMTAWMQMLEDNGKKALERAQARKVETQSTTATKKKEVSDSSSDDEPAAAAATKPKEMPKETPKETPKEMPKETPKEMPKETPKEQSKEVKKVESDDELSGMKKPVEPEEERDLPSSPRSPRSKKEKREKKEKRSKKEKREKKEKKPAKKESSSEEEEETAVVEEKKPVESTYMTVEDPEKAPRKDSQLEKKFELSDSSDDDKPAQKRRDSDDSDEDSD